MVWDLERRRFGKMQAVGRLSSYISRGVYTVSAPFHPFGGAVDIIVVQQQDGSFKSNPWYVRFGKFQGVLKTTEKVVSIGVNETEAGFHMYLDHTGEAFFLREVEGDEGDAAFSPPLSGDEVDEQVENGRLTKSQSLDLHCNQSKAAPQIDMSHGKIVARTNTRRSRIFGLMFGGKSMNEGSMHSEGDVDVQRISSLERAEIAADLLDVKWSTNLHTDNQRTDDTSSLSASKILAEMADNVQVSVEGMGSQDHGVAQPTSYETRSPHDDVRDRSSGCSKVDAECSDEIRGPNHQCIVIAHEQVLLESTSSSDLADRNEYSTQEATACSDEMRLRSTSETLVLELQDPDFAKLDEGSSPNATVPDSAHTIVELASNNEDNHLTSHGVKGEEDCVSKEESKEKGISSYIYNEALVSSSTGVQPSEPELEIPNCHGQCLKEVEVHTEVVCKTAELIPEMNLLLESNALASKGTLHEGKDSCESHQPGDDHESEGTFENLATKDIDLESSVADGGQVLAESLSSLNMVLSTADIIKAEIVEVIHDDTVVEGLTAEKISVVKQVEGFENEFQLTDFSSSQLPCDNKVSDEKTLATTDSFIQMADIGQKVGLNEDEESGAMCTFPSNSINHVREGEDQGEGDNMHQLQVSSEVIIGPQEYNVSSPPEKVVNSSILSESLEEDPLIFGNIDNLVANGVLGEKPISEDGEEADSYLREDIDEEHASNDTNHDSPWSSNRSFGFQSFSTAASYSSELVQDLSSSPLESFPEESKTQTSPISIPKSCWRSEGLREMEGSAPNTRGHIHDLERSGVLQPLSHSLDSRSQNLKWSMHRKELLTTLKSQVTSESHSEQDLPVSEAAIVDARMARELARISTNPAVEISLCRHLLFEGMGADAASQAFDSEKVDLEKFNALGPSIVKNDRLVVRMGSRYFPWDEAASNVLGTVAFGKKQIIQPESMIRVDKVENALKGELSRTIVRSSGSWRIWPFRFGITRTASSIRSAPDVTVGTDADSGSESMQSSPGDNSKMHSTRSIKKKVVRSLVPTSEQLASLNLKEGQNVVTFTFSTSMLGKQQVDAKIYLWKWNTRIVISDVDGTITKSDVLGQFMPLVGKDWSHLGVAHLFSAIKENGYQLLFLSARAISQASLTRQFLFNLKQDGKALPDGPVVISPDGLFPSLFREVIRRAPHEFKIACLEDIKALFPCDCNPFYAGFGNRDTDEISYLKVGIPKGKIFIINPKGEVAVNRRVDTRSYTSLHALVNGIFPVMSSAEQEDYNSWNYWKMPLPEIDGI